MNFKNRKLVESAVAKIVKRVIAENRSQLDDDVEEVVLYAENDHWLCDVLMKTYLPALQKFVKKGTFDRERALKLMEYYWTNYVRPAYKKEFGDVQLKPPQRRQFSEYFLSSLEDDGYLNQGQ